MIRVVIDTNVLISALLQPGSLPATALMLALSRHIQLCVSDAVFAGYDEAIRRPRLKRSPEIIKSSLQSIRKLGHWVTPTVRVTACTDADDNVLISPSSVGSLIPVVLFSPLPVQYSGSEVIRSPEMP